MISKGVMIKVTCIRILDHLDAIDIENDNMDVSVETDDGYTYTLSFATPKHLQFLMDKEKMDYYGPGYPFIVVNKLTPEIIEQAVKAFAENNSRGYWLKVYHFGGWAGAIDESIFDQLKAEDIKEQREFDKLMKLKLMREIRCTLKDLVNKTDLIYLVKKYRSGNQHSAIKISAVPDTCLTELRTRGGIRIYLQKKTNNIEMVAICDKDNQDHVLWFLNRVYGKK
jgi:hypothetical protein